MRKRQHTILNRSEEPVWLSCSCVQVALLTRRTHMRGLTKVSEHGKIPQ